MSGSAFDAPGAGVALREGEVIAQKYRLTRLIRRGGMGSVWEAHHLGLQSAVVIKFVRFTRNHADPSAEDALEEHQLRMRFDREARAAAQIRSANVVQILDYGVDRGTPYLVMELLQGEDLSTRLKREGRLGLAATARVVGQIARALERAHAVGLVHRDLKPGNVFLARDGDEEVVKVLDFGVAKELRGERAAEDSTVDGVVIGTPSYMSPEQAMGRTDVDQRADLWSLGVIAYRCLCGVNPFAASMLLEAVLKICSAPIPAATSVAPDLPAEVDRFFLRALARAPDERFQSARELARTLEALAASHPSTSGEPIRVVTAPGSFESAFTPSGGSRIVPASTLTTVSGPASQVEPRARGRGRAMLVAFAVLVGVVAGALGFALRPATSGDPTPAPAVAPAAAPATGGARSPAAATTDAAPTDAAPTDAAPTDAAPTGAAPTDAAPPDADPSAAAPPAADAAAAPSAPASAPASAAARPAGAPRPSGASAPAAPGTGRARRPAGGKKPRADVGY